MTYSLDSEANRHNAHSPSEHLTVNEQLLYKLAALDSAVTQGFRRLDEKMTRFQSDLHENQINTNDRINTLDKEFREAIALKRSRIDALVGESLVRATASDLRLTALETWKQVAIAKIGLFMSLVGAVWVFFAPSVRDFFHISNS